MKYEYSERDLSWLSFNYRVLEEAKDHSLPLYERIRFLAIFSSNLDEFFRVRVAAIQNIIRLNQKKLKKAYELPPDKLIHEILSTVEQQQTEYGQVFSEIIKDLQKENITLQLDGMIREEHKDYVLHYFRTRILGFLTPQILTGHPVHLENRQLYLAVKMQPEGQPGNIQFGLVNIPSDKLSRFLQLPKIGIRNYFIMLDDILRHELNMIFPEYEILESYAIKLNRDAELQLGDEHAGNLTRKIKKQLKKRPLGPPSRFLYDKAMPEQMQGFLKELFGLEQNEMVEGGRYHNMNDLSDLPNPRSPELESRLPDPVFHQAFERKRPIFDAIDEGDIALHFPYHSYDHVLLFFNEASIDPYVTRIRATFYRVAPDSYITNALISAARNGKKVMAFFEVKARFDESNNLYWADLMKKAGIKVIYSLPGLKVHAKVAIVERKKGKKITRYGYYGTGNFNEKTARVYADHAILTCNADMNRELVQLFSYLKNRKKKKKFKHLLVSQFNLRGRLIDLIDNEIDNASEGRSAGMILKMNNLEDPDLIDKLYEASNAGVRISLVIRSICRLVPGVKGQSENIKVLRLVDSFLEHARIFYFTSAGAEELYVGSADWMIRNLYHRIEVVFPVHDESIKKQLKQLLAFQLTDNVKARRLDAENHNSAILKVADKRPVRAQKDFRKWLIANP